MASLTLKTALYERDITITEIALRAGTSTRNACNALIRWEGRTGTPRGKVRKVLKAVEAATGKPVYTEAC